MLTKSDFLTYLESPLHLWAKKHNQWQYGDASPYSKHLKTQGYQVQELAQKFLQQKVNTQYPDADLRFEQTLINGDYESRVDAVVHDNIYDTYDLYEIKSTTSVHKEHEYDVTFQYLVGKESLRINKVYLVYINRNFVKAGDIEVMDFFVVDDMTNSIKKKQNEVILLREEALKTLALEEPPHTAHCYYPSKCKCLSLCHPHLSEYPIYDLCGGTQKIYKSLSDLGVQELNQINGQIKLSYKQQLQIDSVKKKQPIIDTKAIKKELAHISFPIYFLDYETFSSAIPLYDHYSPYQNIVFQYSVHVLENPDAELTHFEYVVTDTDEPSESLTKRLLSVIGDTGTIVVWNKSFECGRNQELARLQPQYEEQLIDINNRVYDLMDPFKIGCYVDYRFHGSASIKHVLPILVPELSYKEMNIGEGTAAMIAWFKLTHDQNSVFEGDTIKLKNQLIQDLLDYCELDTLAMVEIWRNLTKLVSK